MAFPVLLTAFVPTHRCGAAPDSHRIPSCDDLPGGQAGQPVSTGERRQIIFQPWAAFQQDGRGAELRIGLFIITGSDPSQLFKHFL